MWQSRAALKTFSPDCFFEDPAADEATGFLPAPALNVYNARTTDGDKSGAIAGPMPSSSAAGGSGSQIDNASSNSAAKTVIIRVDGGDLGRSADGYTSDRVTSTQDTTTSTSTTLTSASSAFWTTQQIANQLTTGFWGGTYRAFNVGADKAITVNLTGLDATYKAFARQALQTWKDATGISFNETGGAAEITFTETGSLEAWSSSWGSGTTLTSSIVNIAANWLTSQGTPYTFQTFIHEIGHALGLGHAGNYNGAATYGVNNLYANDSWQATVMSYFSQTQNTAINASFAYLLTPMLADVVAIRDLYGSTGITRTGDTVYGYNSNAGDPFTETVIDDLGTNYALTIIDNGGNDTIDLSGSSDANFINLQQGGISNTGGLVGNISIAIGTIIESAKGGSGNDTIVGNEANNLLYGNDSNDSLAGGGGNDQLWGGNGNDLLVGGAHVRPLGVSGSVDLAGYMGPAWVVAAIADTNGNGFTDIIWKSSGSLAIWSLGAGTFEGFHQLAGSMGAEWSVAAMGDFNGDGMADVLWENNGQVAIWELSGFSLRGSAVVSGAMGAEWRVCGVSDLNLDGYDDIIWANDSGQIAVWSMYGSALGQFQLCAGNMGAAWTAIGLADVLGSGREAILWESDSGQLMYWDMYGGTLNGLASFGALGTDWIFSGSADLNGDSTDDLVWRKASGEIGFWEMVSGQVTAITTDSYAAGGMTYAGAGTFTGDGIDDLLWFDGGNTDIVDVGKGFGDWLSGGSGADTFRFNAISEAGKTIADFQSGLDKLDLDLFLAEAGYNGANAIQDQIVRIIQAGDDALVQYQPSGQAGVWESVAKLLDTDVSLISASDFIF